VGIEHQEGGHVVTRPKHRRELTANEIEIVQLVARGLTNAQICQHLGVRMPTVQARIRAANVVIGAQTGNQPQRGTAAMCRVNMVIWAYENGLVGEQDRADREQQLAERAFAVLRGLVFRRPMPLLRDEAVAIIREADADLCLDVAA
jgi:hypothetical protein